VYAPNGYFACMANGAFGDHHLPGHEEVP
jgi:hypothetical protein